MISIGRYRFDGPVYQKSALRAAAGVYVVLDHRPGGYYVLDVGESENIQERISSHDREPCWRRNRKGRICYAALYLLRSTRRQREAIERELRAAFKPACGVR